ncbi:unnamed protein product [Linum trigynum]
MSSMVSSLTKNLVSINTTSSPMTSIRHLTRVALVIVAVANVGGHLLVAVDATGDKEMTDYILLTNRASVSHKQYLAPLPNMPFLGQGPFLISLSFAGSNPM